MAKQRSPDILCDLCEEEPALSFCDECHHKLGDICLLAHTRQKRTKDHNVNEIENVKLSVLKVRCSSCENQAEKFCPDCDIRLCVQCAGRHHTLRDTLASIEQLFDTYHGSRLTSSDETSLEKNAIYLSSDCDAVDGKPEKSAQETDDLVTSTDSSNIDSASMPSKVHVKEIAEQQGPDIVCDLCEDEQALRFCDECQNKLGDICLLAHTKQKRTNGHHVDKIENVQLLFLKVTCSLCMDQAERFCAECDACLCIKCTETHHKLNDTLSLTKPIFDTAFSVVAKPFGGHNGSTNKTQDELLSGKDLLNQKPDLTVEEINKPASHNPSYMTKHDSEDENKSSDEQKNNRENTHEQLAVSQFLLDKNLDQSAEQTSSEIGKVYKQMKPVKKHSFDRQKKSLDTDQVQYTGDQYPLDGQSDQTVEERSKPSSPDSSNMYEQNSSGEKQSLDRQESDTGNNMMYTQLDEIDEKGQLRNSDVSKSSKSGPLIDTNAYSSNLASLDGNGSQEDIPGQPFVGNVYTDSVNLAWTGVKNFIKGDTYQVHIENHQTAKWHRQNFTCNNGRITSLDPGASYVFKVRLVKANGDELKYSEKSEVVTTHMTFASRLVCESIPVETDQEVPGIYALPMEELPQARNEIAMTKKYDIGSRGKDDINEKTIMLVGATGTGKSTLVDGIANYVLGVRLEDPFRFTVMQEEDRVKQRDQAISQTDWITCYSFNPKPGTRLMYRLNVIDTPGFGDTRGLEIDQNIIEQIRQLFEETGERGIQTIDAVCFLLKAPDSRMTASQKYIFHAIMSMFGQDIEDNICTLITFADGSNPPVLSAVKASDLPFGKTFTFNNSALFSDPSNTFTSMFWDMGLKSFEALFNHFKTLETKSIQLTKEVLQERQRLETTCQNLHLSINVGLLTIQRLRTEIRFFIENEDEINRNENFTYVVNEIKIMKVDLPAGVHVTNCLTCNRTCHDNCMYADDNDKQKCCAMDSSGHCAQCPGKCHWTMHKNAPFRIEFNEVKVTKTYDDMKRKYQEAQGKIPTLEQVLCKMVEELERLTDEIEEMVDDMRKCNNRLKEIALRPNPLGMIDQIDLMIQAEKDEGRPGFQKRIEVLKRFREKAAIGESVKRFRDEKTSIKGSLQVANSSKVKIKDKPFWKFWG